MEEEKSHDPQIYLSEEEQEIPEKKSKKNSVQGMLEELELKEKQQSESEQLQNQFKQKYPKKVRDYIDSSSKILSVKKNQETNFTLNTKKLIRYLDTIEDSDCQLDLNSYSKVIQKSKFFLKTGSNLLIHGIGSKIDFLDAISQQLEEEAPILNIQGYLPGSNIQRIIQEIYFIYFKHHDHKKTKEKESKKTSLQIEYIKNHFDQLPYDYLLVVFHNIDAKQFRESDTQTLLSELASVSNIRFLASIDHYRYPVLLQQEAYENFHFQHLNINTEQPYIQEFKTLQNIKNKKKNQSISALKHVLKSFTRNQKDVVSEVARFLSEHPKEHGITFRQLFEICQDECILAIESQLKENLLEILDHKVMIIKEANNKSYYNMNYPPYILKQLADKLPIKDEDELEDQEKQKNKKKDNQKQKKQLKEQQQQQTEDEDDGNDDGDNTSIEEFDSDSEESLYLS